MIVGKTFDFCAAHFIPNHPKCGEIHGHDYKVTVELTGDVDSETGMVVDFTQLSNEMYIVLGKIDHSFLNKIIPIPTCEHLCFLLHKALSNKLDANIFSISVQEGGGGYAKLLCE